MARVNQKKLLGEGLGLVKNEPNHNPGQSERGLVYCYPWETS
jgi:hypothetical protein